MKRDFLLKSFSLARHISVKNQWILFCIYKCEADVAFIFWSFQSPPPRIVMAEGKSWSQQLGLENEVKRIFK